MRKAVNAVEKQHQEIFQKVLPALQTKMSEFKFYEYDSITLMDLWNYCVEKKWRKKAVQDLHIHEIVSIIFSVTPSEIVNHDQINHFKTADWFSEMNKAEFQLLLRPQLKDGNNQ